MAPTDSRLADSPRIDHDPDGEEQCERNGRADNDGAAQVAEKRPLQQEDQRDSEHHVVQDGSRRDADQVLAVIDAFKLERRAAGFRTR